MRTIGIGLELVFGPVLKDTQLSDGSFSSGSLIVDNDEIVNKLDREINALWCSLYSKNENNSSGIQFDYEKEKMLAPQLLKMLNELIKRICEINDGSYEIQDMITDHLIKIIEMSK